MFFSKKKKKKNNVYPCKPQFYCIKVGFKGIKIIQVSFRDGVSLSCFTNDVDDTYANFSDYH